MRSFSSVLALAASLTSVSAVSQGFNYGATKSDGSFMYQADYEASFKNAKGLVGTNGGFTSARLYTMIQGGSSTNEPTQAIPAAISEGVTLLLGLWASAGDGNIQAEITALKSAIAQYGDAFTKLVVGISVGSEDLYRISPTGIAALSGYGANPADIVKYIGEVKTALSGTSLSGASIGHVDTWTAWVNGSNSAVVDAVDWIGVDAYPYFQNTMANSISDGKQLFNDAYAATEAASKGKPVWVTETGWPVSGKTEGQGVPNTANAKTYWDEVGCPLFGSVNTWWYTQQDSDPTTPNPSFGLVGSSLTTTPLYDLSCSNVSSSSSAVASSTAVSSAGASSTGSSGDAPLSSATAGTGGSSSGGSSAIASLSSAAAASTPIVSGGGGLSPNQGVPTVSNVSASPTGSTGGTSGSGAGSGVSSNGTSVVSPTLTTSKGSGGAATTSGASSSSSSGVAANGAGMLSGSLVGVFGAVFAALAAL